MKTNTKILLSFLGGAVTGALICFAILKEKYEVLANEEIENIKDYYQKEMESMENAYEEELDNLINTMKKYEGLENEEIKNMKDNINKNIEKHHKREEKKTYVDYVKKYNPNEIVKDKYYDIPYPDVIDEDYHEDDELPEDPPENDLQYEKPFVISREEFDEEFLHFDKITITYYEKDDVLADEQDEIIPDVEAVVGYDSLSRFGDMSDDDCVVYVRNVRLGADYEIILAQESYAESVLGIVQDKELSSQWLRPEQNYIYKKE